MGPIDSPYSRCGVEITDSAYVVHQHGDHDAHGPPGARAHRARRQVRQGPALHRRARSRTAASSCISPKSSRSRASARATAATRCSARNAMRCASPAGRRATKAGWPSTCSSSASRIRRARRTTSPRAFPSACGKTNLAMLIPPDSMPGWKIWTVGDDIAWLHPGPDGRLCAINPEAGLLRRRAGHEPRDQPQRLRHDPPRHAVHQRRAHGGQRAVVGRPQAAARRSLDWQGKPLRSGERRRAAHPNSRFTVSAKHNPIYSPRSEDPQGVPISAHRVRRPPPRSRAAGVRSARLAARRARRRLGRLGDHRRRHRRGRRRAPRPDGDEAVLPATTSATTGSTGSTSGKRSRIRRSCSTSTGSAATRRASSCGRASATTCA